MIRKLNLQQFAEEGGAAAAPAAGGETATTAAGTEVTAEAAQPAVNAGETLPDGTRVQNARVAAALENQMKRHPELRGVYGKAQPTPPAQGTEQPEPEKTAEDRWNEAKKGEFAEFYGRDVQAAIRDRFKNAQDTQAQIDKLEQMLKVLRDRAGVSSNDELIQQVMDDDSLYEDEANARGMTIPAYRQMKELEDRMHAMQEAEAQRQEDARVQQHFRQLEQQAEKMKEIYPDFDLQKELADRRFFRLTSPEGGLSI